jgi:UDP-N-acetylglucosamine 2-epimerase (non-hydrolysing)
MILICFGTRPEWLKIKPIIDKIHGKLPYRLVCTGQHQSLIDLSIKKYTVEYLDIEKGRNRLDDIVISILKMGDNLFNGINYVMVQGDTTSAFAVALGAFHRKIPVIHLEAGLRSWDINNPYPEEFNRISISNIASIHLCPTKDNAINIQLYHKSNNGKTYVVGNTVLDNLKYIYPILGKNVLITLHRRENLDIIDKWFIALDNIAQNNQHLKFIFPMHPNPAIQQHKHLLKSVRVIEPLCYSECIEFISQCALVITDSGGLQEESSFFKKKCIVCRKTTERQEGEYIFSQLCPEPEMLERIFNNTKIELVDQPCPYGDGNASEKILDILRNLYDKY